MKNRFLVSLLAVGGLLLAPARPALGQAPIFTEALGISPSVAGGGSFSRATATNAAGDQYVTGNFFGTLALGNSTLVSTGATDTFVAKRSGRTGAWLWAVRAGGTSFTYGQGVAVDASGNALVAGAFEGGASFDGLSVVGGTRGLTGFVAKLQAAGPSATAPGLNKTTLTLAPNPARTAATLTLPAAAHLRAMTVADAPGRVALKTTLPAQVTALTLDVTGLAPGVYTVRGAAATARLVVE